MIKVFQNIYQAENFSEKLNKKCCQSVIAYLVKCLVCEGFVCFHHVRTLVNGKKKQLVCVICFYNKSS